MEINRQDEDNPEIVYLFKEVRRGRTEQLRARSVGASSGISWRFIFIHDLLVSYDSVEYFRALSKMLGAEPPTTFAEELEIYNLYLDSKYPTYSYH